MNLLCERKQTSAPFTFVPLQIGGGVMFTLWAKTELDEEEQGLLKKYNFEDALLIADDPSDALRRALRAAIILGIAIWIVVWLVTSITTATGITLLAILILTAVYYNELRGHIYVRDLVHGRTFRCFSVVELLQQEERLKFLAGYLRQVMESAKHWDGREAVPIPPLSREDAKQLVLKSLRW